MNEIVVKKVFSIEGVLGAAVYLALGLAVYMWLGIDAGVVFSWAEPWLYIYGLLWPFILLYYFLKWAMIAVVLIGAGFFIWAMTGGRGR